MSTTFIFNIVIVSYYVMLCPFLAMLNLIAWFEDGFDWCMDSFWIGCDIRLVIILNLGFFSIGSDSEKNFKQEILYFIYRKNGYIHVLNGKDFEFL